MAKRLEEFLKPASKGDATFMALHKVKTSGTKKPDVATKTYKRKEDRMGYDSPEDEEAYKKAIGEAADKKSKAEVMKASAVKWREHAAKKKAVKEDAEQIDESKSMDDLTDDQWAKVHGHRAGKSGHPHTNNPYGKNTKEHDIWKKAHKEGREDPYGRNRDVKEDVVVEYTINDIQQQMIRKHGTVDQEALKKLRTLGHGRYKKEHLAQIGQESLFEGVDLKDLIIEGMSDDAKELMIHGDNDSAIHRQSHMPIIKNLQRKIKNGTYDHEKAKKLWGYKATAAAQSYTKTYGEVPSGRKSSVGTFTKKTRDEVASHWADREHASIMNGDYGDGHIPKEKGKPVVKEDTVDEGLRLIKTHTEGPHSAKVYKDNEWEEHRVKFYKDGKHLTKADYHTNDVEDAHNTAKHQLKKMNEDTVDESKKEKKTVSDVQPNGGQGYSKSAVDAAIKSSRKKIGGKEAKAIHALLKGRH